MLATTAAMIEQFNKNNILILEDMGYEVHVVGNWKEGNPISDERLEQFKEWLSEHNGKWFHIPATRKPYDLKNNYVAYKEVVRLIIEYEYEFIHCHTPIGSVIGRVAAHFTKTKIIYTAHGFHFYKGAPLLNWLLYYPVERILSRWTDILILINKEDFARANKKFSANDTIYVKGVGIDRERIMPKNVCDIRTALSIPENGIVFLSVGELNKNKNHRIVLEAMAKIRNKDIYYLICGTGSLMRKLKCSINELGLDKNVFLLGYQMDMASFYRCADVFILPSYREGLSVALMEAMAAGLPILCSQIRGNTDLVRNGTNGYLFNPDSAEEVVLKMKRILNKDIRDKMSISNKRDIEAYYEEAVCEQYKKIYELIDDM